MKDTEKDIYFAQGVTDIIGSHLHPETWMYRMNQSGVFVRETEIDSGKYDGVIVEIVQITDVHFNYLNKEDESNEEVMYTKTCRDWNADGESVGCAKKAMEYANFFDQTVVTGDTLDYLTYGAMELTQKYIWDADPEALICLGGHDVTRQMETNLSDKTPLKERHEVLQKFWKHDIFYTSKVIKNKVMVVQLDNSCHRYWDCQVEKLRGDIQIAREKGYVMLVFQHEPISTRKPEDIAVKAFKLYYIDNIDFYKNVVGGEPSEDAATKEVYRLLTQNTDVIRGIFCGHQHSAFYTEIKGTYTTPDGTTYEKMIPQPVCVACPYDDYAGHVMKITVK